MGGWFSMVNEGEESFLLYINTHYNNILNISKQFGEYSEFKNRYSELISKKPLDKLKCDIFLVNFYKKILEDAINSFLSRINENEKLRCNVQKEITNLKKIKEKLWLNNLKLLDLYKLKDEINETLNYVWNQDNLIKLTNREKWKERGIGILIALGTGIILKIFGIV